MVVVVVVIINTKEEEGERRRRRIEEEEEENNNDDEIKKKIIKSTKWLLSADWVLLIVARRAFDIKNRWNRENSQLIADDKRV